MNYSFLQRFVESPSSIAHKDDKNSDALSYRSKTCANRMNAIFAGTKTMTEVKREQSDQDPITQSVYVFPK